MSIKNLSELGFVTTNFGKFQETKSILGLRLLQINLFYSEPQEVQGEEIAAAKARTAYSNYKIPLIADHTSLYIDAWNGFPGGLTGTMLRQVGDASFLKMMEGFRDRHAMGQTAIAFCDGPNPVVFTGEISGYLTKFVSGIEYTGWDRIFIPDGQTKSYGEMQLEEKNKISQRRIALDKLKVYLVANYQINKPD